MKQTHDILGKVPCKMPGGCQALVLNGLISVDLFAVKNYTQEELLESYSKKLHEN